MDLCSLEPLLLIWTLLSRLGGFALEISVRDSELKPCEGNDRVCVTDLSDCRLPPSSSQKVLNMSCYYQEALDRTRSVTCSWSQESESEASLVFTSEVKIASCLGIFNPAAVLSVTARIKSYLTGRVDWSRPHTLVLFDAVKPSRPALALIGSMADSVVVSWKSSVDGSCRLRYRANDTRTWTQVSDLVPAHDGQDLNYTITNLRPFMAYKAAVACRKESGTWSDWSEDTSIQTLDEAPSRPAEMCYRVEKTCRDGALLLHLIWMASDPGRVLGYQVRISPPEHLQNVTGTTSVLVVKEGNYSVAVRAFNTAGFGPAARLQIDTQTRISRPSVRNLWISSGFPENEELLVRWTFPSAPSSVPPGSHAAVKWRSEENPSSGRWVRVDGSASSAVITDVDPDESYLVGVFPIYNQQCGPPQFLAASLQHGALTLWPDQQQHTFSNLTPSTEYSLLLLADNVSRTIIPVATYFDEVPAVATATPLLLLVVTVMIISVLSRTLYKSYFFPPISSPRRSTAGQWLLNPNLKKCAERNFLDITDFQVTDLILVGPNHQLSSALHKEKSLQSASNLFVQMSAGKLGTVDVTGTKPVAGHEFNVQPITEQQIISLQSVFTSEEIGGTDEESSCSPQRVEDVLPPSHHQGWSALTFQCPELLTDFLRQPEPESGPLECSSLVHEVEYLTNGCFRAEPTAGDETKDGP
ncbi:uncharacterized protein FYW61_013070 isoform 2-T2 [Anableps anableps]